MRRPAGKRFCSKPGVEQAEVRAAFLERECAGDDALRGRVKALIEAHEVAGGFMVRRILIDGARRKCALRHGGQQDRVDLADIDVAAPAADDELLAVNDALEKFAQHEPFKAELVKLRYFVGMTIEEAAQVLNISPGTAKRHWTYARAWLYDEIRRTGVQ